MGTTWADEIERSFGDGPTPPAPAAYVVPGRAALRRRRLAAAAASVAACLVLGGVGWAALPGGSGPDAGEVATDTSPSDPSPSDRSPSETVAPDEGEPSLPPELTVAPVATSPGDIRLARPGERRDMAGAAAVTVLGDGTLIRRAGWTVERLEVQQADDRARTWGIAATRDDGSEGEWILLTWEAGGGSTATWNPPGQRFATFDEWLAVTLEELQGAEGEPIARTRNGVLVDVATGTTVDQQVVAPPQAAAYGPVEDFVAARFRLFDGTEVFGLAGPEGTTTVDPAVLETPTMAAFLRHLEAQGDSGEGLR
jgi:hypothetical protein